MTSDPSNYYREYSPDGLYLGTVHLKSGRGADDLGGGHKISNIVFEGF